MYKNFMASSIKVLGKPLKELEEKVYLPFGSEYSIMLHNYNSVKALVDISIDGEDVFTGLVIRPNESVNLERRQSSPHKFKFIERTKNVEDKRGIRIEDGTVRISFKYEKEIFTLPYYPWCTTKVTYYGTPLSNNVSCNYRAQGITVPGSESDQKITYTGRFQTEDKETVIVYKLFGGEVLDTCTSCGHKLKAGKYCWYCGVPIIKEDTECKVCGANISPNDKYCKECGVNLKA